MKSSDDAFGWALYDAWRGSGRGYHIVEREDGLLDALESATYFRPPSAWEPFERQALRYARGRVLDIGCGAAARDGGWPKFFPPHGTVYIAMLDKNG